MQNKVDEAYLLITDISEGKLLNDEDANDVANWTKEKQKRLEVHDTALTKLEEFSRDAKFQADEDEKQRVSAAAEERRKSEFLLDQERFDGKKKFELELEEEKQRRTKDKSLGSKVPKLQITKFEGTFVDWLRFWQQFEEEIDKRDEYAPITKFQYLLSYMSDKPKTEIAGLPFTAEGYQEATTILKNKYGVTSEIVHAHGKSILQLPTIHKDYSVKMIHEFYRSLNVSVNSLKTLGKLDTAEILVRGTLEKLGPIKTELISLEPHWQEWNLQKLLDSLRAYII